MGLDYLNQIQYSLVNQLQNLLHNNRNKYIIFPKKSQKIRFMKSNQICIVPKNILDLLRISEN